MKRGAESDPGNNRTKKLPVNSIIGRRERLAGPFEVTDGVGHSSDHELSKPLSKPKII